MNKIAVLGSLNMDLVVESDRFPEIGETIIGEKINYFMGGKGANQGVAASRTGSEVTFLGKVGRDTFGEKLIAHLKEEKMDISHVEIEKNIFTGIASIIKLPTDNSIIVIPGANDLVDIEYVHKNKSIIENSDVLLTQLEIPVTSVKEAMRLAKNKQVITILNPAPYDEKCLSIIKYTDYITPNETEFASMCLNLPGKKLNLEQKMIDWQNLYETRLIVTRGEIGVSYVENNQVVTVPGGKVKVVDTTGAGDTFNGILATALGQKIELLKAIQLASYGASLSVTKLGAQSGMPKVSKVIDLK